MDRLEPGRSLCVGQALTSPSGEHRLRMCGDGDLVLETSPGRRRWSTGTADLPALDRPTTVQLQPDGDLVLRSASGVARWSAGTAGAGTRPALVLRDDGSLVVLADREVPVWAADSTSGSPGVRFAAHEEVAAAQRITITGVLGGDGLLVADVVTVNRAVDDVLRGRALAVVHGEGDRTIWVSGVFAAGTRAGVGDVTGTCVGACGGQEPWREQFPAVVGRRARRVEVRLANSRSARVSLPQVRQRIVDDLTGPRGPTGPRRRDPDPGVDELVHAWSFLFK